MTPDEMCDFIYEWCKKGFDVDVAPDLSSITVTKPIISARPDIPPCDECALYRYYDADGALLYIGITNDIDVRDKAHWTSAKWRLRAETVLIETYPARMIAEYAEAQAIADELPPENRKWPTMRWKHLKESRYSDWIATREGYRGDNPEWRLVAFGYPYFYPEPCATPEWFKQ